MKHDVFYRNSMQAKTYENSLTSLWDSSPWNPMDSPWSFRMLRDMEIP